MRVYPTDAPMSGPVSELSRVNPLAPDIRPWSGQETDMFFLFSNRLGCLGSLLVSAVVTVVLVLLLRH